MDGTAGGSSGAVALQASRGLRDPASPRLRCRSPDSALLEGVKPPAETDLAPQDIYQLPRNPRCGWHTEEMSNGRNADLCI